MDESRKLNLSVNARTWINMGNAKRAFDISLISVSRDQHGVSVEFRGSSAESLESRMKIRLSPDDSRAMAQLIFGVNHET
jgi:hypothetical protein